MDLETVSDTRKFRALEPEWKALAEKDQRAWLFQHHVWLSAMVDLEVSRSTELRVVCLRDSGQLIGAAPFVLTTKFKPFKYSVLRFLGQGLADFNDVLIHPDFQSQQFFELLAGWVVSRRFEIHRVELENVAAGSHLIENLSLLKLDAHFVSVDTRVMEKCQFIQLPISYDKYLESLQKRKRHDLKRRGRRIYSTFSVDINCVKKNQDEPRIFDILFALHQKRQESQYQRGLFYNSLREKVFRALFSRLMEEDLIVMHVLKLDSEVAIVKVAFDYHGRRVLYTGGISYSPKYSKYGIGKWFSLCQIEDSIALGLAEVNFGRGGEAHKSDFGTNERPNFQIIARDFSVFSLLHTVQLQIIQYVYRSKFLCWVAFCLYKYFSYWRNRKS